MRHSYNGIILACHVRDAGSIPACRTVSDPEVVEGTACEAVLRGFESPQTPSAGGGYRLIRFQQNDCPPPLMRLRCKG